MKLADVKRRLQVGTRVTLRWHKYADGFKVIGNTGTTVLPSKLQIGTVREVCIVRSAAVAFRRLDDPTAEPSWLHWPKAADLLDDGDNGFTILENGTPMMSYRIEDAS